MNINIREMFKRQPQEKEASGAPERKHGLTVEEKINGFLGKWQELQENRVAYGDDKFETLSDELLEEIEKVYGDLTAEKVDLLYNSLSDKDLEEGNKIFKENKIQENIDKLNELKEKINHLIHAGMLS